MVAIGRLVMSTRERICAIEIEEGGLVLTTLRTAEEVRALDEVALPELPKPDPKINYAIAATPTTCSPTLSIRSSVTSSTKAKLQACLDGASIQATARSSVATQALRNRAMSPSKVRPPRNPSATRRNGTPSSCSGSINS